MTALPTPNFWLHTLGSLALQVAALVAVAAALERCLKSAPARRAVWQGALLGLVILSLNAFTGGDRALARWAKTPPAPGKTAVVRGNLAPTLDTKTDDLVRVPLPPSRPASAALAPQSPSAWWPLWLWMIGAAAIGARALGSRLLLARFARRGRLASSPEISERLTTLSAGLGLRRPVRLVRSAALKGPIAFGWLRPTIGLPRRFFDRHTPPEQDTMLAHELAHIAARDPLWLALADGLCALLWWHPAVWWLRRQFRAASETAADDASLLVQDGPAVLAECLVNLATQMQPRRASGWLGMAEFRSGLGRRVERLLNLPADAVDLRAGNARWVAPALVVTVLLSLAGMAWAFPAGGNGSPTLLAVMQDAVYPQEPAISELRPKAKLSVTGIERNLLPEWLATVAADSGRADPSQPSSGATRPDRQQMLQLLERIRFDEIGFESVPLGEVQNKLLAEANRLAQPTHELAFMTIMGMPGAGGIGSATAPGSFEAQFQPGDLRQVVRVTVRPPLKAASLGAVLDAVVRGAKPPIKYSVEDVGIVFSAQGMEPVPLYSKTFKLDWRRLEAAFGGPGFPQPGSPSSGERGLLNELAAAGWIGWGQGQVWSFIPPPDPQQGAGAFFVRAPQTNLDLIETVIQKLGVAAEPSPGNAKPAPVGASTNGHNKPLAAQMVQDARLLYEMGKLDEAEPRLKRAIQFDPDNGTASYYAELVQAAHAAKTAQAATNSEAAGQLFTRTYKVDFHALSENMRNSTGQGKTNALSTHEALDWYFRAAGWNRATNESFFLNEGSGVLFVRARQASLDLVDSVLQVLTATTPQVVVEAKFVEISQEDSQAIGFDWILGSSTLAGSTGTPARVTTGLRSGSPAGVFPGGGPVSAAPRELRGNQLDWVGRDATNAQNIRVSAALGATINGILTDPQFRVVVKALEQRRGVEMLSSPSVTTLSGRQAQIRVQEMKAVVTGPQSPAGTNAPTTAVIPCGPVLDLLPTVLADGVTIQLKLKASVTEFLGYDPAPPGAAAGPQPRFRERQLETTANIWDGQTLVLGGPVVEAAAAGPNATPGSRRKQLLLFVTPTLVDPAGNRVHTDDEMPFSTNGVPPQPRPGK